jgi:hypothetical protein
MNKLKDFIYNKETNESNLAGVIFVAIVTVIAIYYVWWMFSL